MKQQKQTSDFTPLHDDMGDSSSYRVMIHRLLAQMPSYHPNPTVKERRTPFPNISLPSGKLGKSPNVSLNAGKLPLAQKSIQQGERGASNQTFFAVSSNKGKLPMIGSRFIR